MARRQRPVVSAGIVARPRLWERLDGGAERACTTVVAGPGWGKSVLVAGWAERIGYPVAWLTLEPGDRAADSFWTALLDAVRDGGAVPDDHPLATLRPGVIVDDAFVDAVVEAFEQLAEPIVVVLDDVHELAGDAAGPVPAGLEEVLAGTEVLRVVMVGREVPPVPLHRLRLTGRLTEITPEDLAFTAGEARELFASEGVDLDDAVLDQVMDRTRGWAAPMRLAALQWPARPGLDGLGRTGPVAEYLLREMLDRLDPELREFVVLTGVVDAVTPALAAELTGAGVAPARDRLELLAARHALVTRMEGEGPWFAYHPLLLDLLRERLGARPEVAAELHRRACLWLESDGRWIDALAHSVESQDWPLVADVALRSATALFVDDRRTALLVQLQRIPRNRAHGDAALTTVLAAQAYCRFDIADLARQIAAANAALVSDPGVPEGSVRRGTTLVVLRVLEASLAKLTGAADEMLAAARSSAGEVQALPAREVPAWEVYEDVAEVMTGLAEVWTGAFDAGIRRLTTREVLGRTTASLGVHAAGLRAMGLVLAGRPREAADAAGSVLDRARSHGWDHAPVVAGAWAAAALAALERGDLEVAAATLDTVRAVAAGPAVDAFVRTSVELADVMLRLLTNGPADATTAVEEVDRRLASWRSAGILPAWTAYVVAQVHLAAGEPAAALHRIDAVHAVEDLHLTRDVGLPLGDRLDALAARCHLALGDADAAEAVLLAPQAGRGALDAVTQIELDLAVALVHQARGRIGDAHAVLAAALDRGRTHGSVRPFLAVEADAEGLLRAHAARGGTGAPPAARATAVPPRPGGADLTGREQAVLDLLPSLLTVQEIAAHLHITAHTVRHHLKSVYRKLGVGTRREAVARAGDLGIVGEFAPMGRAIPPRGR